VNTKDKTKQKKRKETTMPGDTRFIITPKIKSQIIKIIDERIGQVHVTKEDFSELKSILKELAEAQKRTEEAQQRTEARLEELAEAQQRTEMRVDSLSQKMEELAEAQKRTEEAQQRTEMRVDSLSQKMEELAEAQKRTEMRVDSLSQKMEELAEAQKRTEEEVRKLAIGLQDTRIQLGGLSCSFSYAFENEAYRNLPKLLYERYGYEITERMVRAEVGGKEINFFGKARKDGKEIIIVGESKVRLDDSEWRREVFEDLENKVNAVRSVYGDVPIERLLVTHFATKNFLDEAAEKGIMVIQSYEW
jgi:DNA repair exonuclease SbcCD ATPase subunit